LYLRRYMVGKGVRCCTFNGGVLETSDTIELGFFEPLQELLELGRGLARKTDDESAAQHEIGTFLAPASDTGECVLPVSRTAHSLQHAGASVLERDVQVGQYPPLRHQWNH